jgi:hypothetical protein
MRQVLDDAGATEIWDKTDDITAWRALIRGSRSPNYGARRISRPRQTNPKAHSIIAVPSTQPRAMNSPHTNQTNKAFADMTGTINKLLLKMSDTALLTHESPICAARAAL